MVVFVLDRRKRPLMPCSKKRHRKFVTQHRAVVQRVWPPTIRLKDRLVEESHLQPGVVKVGPGSKTTGIALARVVASPEGQMYHALHLAELRNRG
jgi:hypothetical protein